MPAAPWWLCCISNPSGLEVWGCTRGRIYSSVTYLAVFLVLAPHLFAQTSRRLAGSVWRDDVVVDQSRQVSPDRGQVSAVGQPWGSGEQVMLFLTLGLSFTWGIPTLHKPIACYCHAHSKLYHSAPKTNILGFKTTSIQDKILSLQCFVVFSPNFSTQKQRQQLTTDTVLNS